MKFLTHCVKFLTWGFRLLCAVADGNLVFTVWHHQNRVTVTAEIHQRRVPAVRGHQCTPLGALLSCKLTLDALYEGKGMHICATSKVVHDTTTVQNVGMQIAVIPLESRALDVQPAGPSKKPSVEAQRAAKPPEVRSCLIGLNACSFVPRFF